MNLKTLEPPPLTLSELTAMLSRHKDNQHVLKVIQQALHRRLLDADDAQANQAV